MDSRWAVEMAGKGTGPQLLQTPIGRLRVVAFAEGCSFLLLLGIAMPLKYLAGIPLAVKVVGWIHGGLFVLFCAALTQAMFAARWSMRRVGLVFASSLVPFGTFVVDGHLKREDEAVRGHPRSAPSVFSDP